MSEMKVIKILWSSSTWLEQSEQNQCEQDECDQDNKLDIR